MKTNLFPSIKLTLVFIILFMGIYTLVILGIAQLAPHQGKGFVLSVDGNKQYENIGQTFSQDAFFWSRPSAVNYNAAGSGGSNKGPSNPDYLALVQARIDSFMVHNPSIKKSEIPSDLVTASGSGEDPNISVQGAIAQIPRVAKARNISEEQLKSLVLQHIEKPLLGFLGTEKINVLKINIALKALK